MSDHPTIQVPVIMEAEKNTVEATYPIGGLVNFMKPSLSDSSINTQMAELDIEEDDGNDELIDPFLVYALLKTPQDRLLLLKLDKDLEIFVNDIKSTRLEFPPMSSYHRKIVHQAAAHFGLAHTVDRNTGNSVIVTKKDGSCVPEVRFFDLIEQEDANPIDKSVKILRRKSVKDPLTTIARTNHNDDKRAMSIEERQQAYQRARARIFKEECENSTSRPIQGSDGVEEGVPLGGGEGSNLGNMPLPLGKGGKNTGGKGTGAGSITNIPRKEETVGQKYPLWPQTSSLLNATNVEPFVPGGKRPPISTLPTMNPVPQPISNVNPTLSTINPLCPDISGQYFRGTPVEPYGQADVWGPYGARFDDVSGWPHPEVGSYAHNTQYSLDPSYGTQVSEQEETPHPLPHGPPYNQYSYFSPDQSRMPWGTTPFYPTQQMHHSHSFPSSMDENPSNPTETSHSSLEFCMPQPVGNTENSSTQLIEGGGGGSVWSSVVSGRSGGVHGNKPVENSYKSDSVEVNTNTGQGGKQEEINIKPLATQKSQKKTRQPQQQRLKKGEKSRNFQTWTPPKDPPRQPLLQHSIPPALIIGSPVRPMPTSYNRPEFNMGPNPYMMGGMGTPPYIVHPNGFYQRIPPNPTNQPRRVLYDPSAANKKPSNFGGVGPNPTNQSQGPVVGRGKGAGGDIMHTSPPVGRTGGAMGGQGTVRHVASTGALETMGEREEEGGKGELMYDYTTTTSYVATESVDPPIMTHILEVIGLPSGCSQEVCEKEFLNLKQYGAQKFIRPIA
eukprot:Ihof_evm8s31 gene=Ihof_evmTU8s31